MEAITKLQAKYGQESEAAQARRLVATTALDELEELLRQHPVRVVPVSRGGIGLDFPTPWWREDQETWQRIAGLFWGDAFDAFVDKYESRLPLVLFRHRGSFPR